ncbi:MAG: hypothetical protein V3V19_01535 [Cocleimonas sp.]
MKKLALASIVFLTFQATPAFAENQKNKGPDIDKVISTLSLQGSQATQLRQLMESHRASMKQLRSEKQKSREKKRALRKSHRKALTSLLNDEQLSKFKAYRKEHHPRGGRKHRKGGKKYRN